MSSTRLVLARFEMPERGVRNEGGMQVVAVETELMEPVLFSSASIFIL
jgi:hypothetical protein